MTATDIRTRLGLSPIINVSGTMTSLGASIVAYDPEAMETAKKALPAPVEFATGSYEALEGADGLVIVTEWSEFRRPNFGKMSQLLKAPVIFDGRNLFEPAKMQRLGFVYYSVGRTPVRP